MREFITTGTWSQPASQQAQPALDSISELEKNRDIVRAREWDRLPKDSKVFILEDARIGRYLKNGVTPMWRTLNCAQKERLIRRVRLLKSHAESLRELR